jgi:hypothetical protein
MAQTLTSPATAPRHSGHLSAGTRPEPEAARALAPTVPAALGNCANAKKMPNRQTGADSCTGGRFTPHRVAMRCSMRRAVAAGNSVAPACSETRREKRRLVRERGPEAIRQSRPGSAPAWLRTPGPERLVTRSVPSSAGSEPADKSVAMALTLPRSSGKTVVGVRHSPAVRPGSISGGSIRPEPAVARGRPERCLEKA